MNSLILFLVNLVFLDKTSGFFISPKSDSNYWVDNQYNIEWDYPALNNNITNIFLTHSNPFVLSKFSNNQLVLSDVIEEGELNYNWHLPYELNHYNVSQINWRILLSNTSTPYSGHIGSHTDNNLIILSNFFKISSNMNISFPVDSNDAIYKYQQYNFTTAGFNEVDPYSITVFLSNENSLVNRTIASFNGSLTNFNNQYVKVEQTECDDLGNNPRQYYLTLNQPEDILNMYNTPFLKLKVEQNQISRYTTTIPILFIKLNIETDSIYQTQLLVDCINYPSSSCNYNLHVFHNGVENIYSNNTSNNFILEKQSGDYMIYASVDNPDTSFNRVISNKIAFTVVQDTTILSTLSPSTISSFYINTNTSCTNDDCEDTDYTMLIIFIILAVICLISAWYYYSHLNKVSKQTNRVHPHSESRNPTNDLEMGNRVICNQNYERNSMTQETSLYGDPETVDSYYPDLNELNNQSDNTLDIYNSRSNKPLVNQTYTSNFKTVVSMPHTSTMVEADSDTPNDSEFTQYYDNYGFKRHIRRRHSSGSYNYGYQAVLPPSFREFQQNKEDNPNFYSHLEKSNSFIRVNKNDVNSSSSNTYSKLTRLESVDSDLINRRKTKRDKSEIEGPVVYKNT